MFGCFGYVHVCCGGIPFVFFLCFAGYCTAVFRCAYRAPVYNVLAVDVRRHVFVALPVVAPGACVAQDQFTTFVTDVARIVVVSFVFFPFYLFLFLFYSAFHAFLFLVCGFPSIGDFQELFLFSFLFFINFFVVTGLIFVIDNVASKYVCLGVGVHGSSCGSNFGFVLFSVSSVWRA